MTDETTALAALLRTVGNLPSIRSRGIGGGYTVDLYEVEQAIRAANVRVAPSPTEALCGATDDLESGGCVLPAGHSNYHYWPRPEPNRSEGVAPSPTERACPGCGSSAEGHSFWPIGDDSYGCDSMVAPSPETPGLRAWALSADTTLDATRVVSAGEVLAALGGAQSPETPELRSRVAETWDEVRGDDNPPLPDRTPITVTFTAGEVRAALAATSQPRDALDVICGAHHPDHPTTTCRRKPGHNGEHATARLDVQWPAATPEEPTP